MKRMKELEEENRRLKEMYAEDRLVSEIRKEALEVKYQGHLAVKAEARHDVSIRIVCRAFAISGPAIAISENSATRMLRLQIGCCG